VCITFPDKLDTAGNPVPNTFSTADVGDAVTVTVERPFTILPLPFIDAATITIRGSATMRIERIASADPVAYSDAQNIGTCS
jgi:hypothetical protein